MAFLLGCAAVTAALVAVERIDLRRRKRREAERRATWHTRPHR